MSNLSPARQHLQRMAAAASMTAQTIEQPSAANYENHLLTAQLYEHKKTLSEIKSVERKIAAKGEMVATYDAYIEGVLKADVGGNDLIFTTLMVWNIDVGRFEQALKMAEYVLRHKLVLPDQYKRDAATLLVDEFSTASMADKLPGEDGLNVLAKVTELTHERDVPDQARAKLHKAIGYALMGKSGGKEPEFDNLPNTIAEAATAQLKRAHELFANVGVKKDLERLERRLKKPEPARAPKRAAPRTGGSVARK